MEIQHKDNGRKGSFFIKENGHTIAELVYVWSSDDVMIINHTRVSQGSEGQGIGKQLLQKAVEMAREQKCKIAPLCSFAKAMFNQTEEYKDVAFN